MNCFHRWICRSGYWRRRLEEEVLPWALEDLDLGENILEIGPGYSAATEILSPREGHLTCVELDMALARSLTRRPTSRNIRVVQAETLHLPFAESAFSAVLCFNVLRRLPSLAHQDRLMAEVARVLRGAGTFAGTDSYAGFLFRTIHIRDTFTPIDPRTLKQRLLATRFEAASVENGAREFRFRAWRSFSGGAVPF